MHIFSRQRPAGESFRILGIQFDCKLLMDAAVNECATQASWKLRTLLRTARFHSIGELCALYASHILSDAEYRTESCCVGTVTRCCDDTSADGLYSE